MRGTGRAASAGCRGAEALCGGARGLAGHRPGSRPLRLGLAAGRHRRAAGKRRRPNPYSRRHRRLELALSPPSAAGRAGLLPPLGSGKFSFRFSFTS